MHWSPKQKSPKSSRGCYLATPYQDGSDYGGGYASLNSKV